MQPLIVTSALLLGASLALPPGGRSGAAPAHASAEDEARGAHRVLKKHLVEIVPLRAPAEALAYLVPGAAPASADDVSLPAPALADLLAYLRARGERDAGAERDYHLHYIVHNKRADRGHGSAAGVDMLARTDLAGAAHHHHRDHALPDVRQDTHEALAETPAAASSVAGALLRPTRRPGAPQHVLYISSDENERSDSLALDFSKNVFSSESGDGEDKQRSTHEGGNGDSKDSGDRGVSGGSGESENGSGDNPHKGDSENSDDGGDSGNDSEDSENSELGSGDSGDSELGNEPNVVQQESEGSGDGDSGSSGGASLESELNASVEDAAGDGAPAPADACAHAHTRAPPCDDACHRHYKLTFLFNR